MLCPSCDRPLNRDSLEGQTVDRCPGCHGIWFDESELGHVIRRMAPPDLTGVEPKCAVTGLECPRCNSTMTPTNYAYDSGIFVNKCHSCLGVWLANGQLELIAKHRIGTPAVQRLASVFADDMRAASKWRRARAIIRSRLLSGIVAAAYLLVAWFTTGDAETVFRLVRFLLLPLACIWFCDGLGSLTGIALGLGRPVITQKTHGDFWRRQRGQSHILYWCDDRLAQH